MSLTRQCECHSPRPKPSGVGHVVCTDCGGEVRARKIEEAAPKRATMPGEADFHRALNNLRREFNEKIDRLKAEYLNR